MARPLKISGWHYPKILSPWWRGTPMMLLTRVKKRRHVEPSGPKRHRLLRPFSIFVSLSFSHFSLSEVLGGFLCSNLRRHIFSDHFQWRKISGVMLVRRSPILAPPTLADHSWLGWSRLPPLSRPILPEIPLVIPMLRFRYLNSFLSRFFFLKKILLRTRSNFLWLIFVLCTKIWSFVCREIAGLEGRSRCLFE